MKNLKRYILLSKFDENVFELINYYISSNILNGTPSKILIILPRLFILYAPLLFFYEFLINNERSQQQSTE